MHLSPKQMLGWGITLTITSIVITSIIQIFVGSTWWWTMISALIRTPFLLLAVVGFVLLHEERRKRDSHRP